jgi:hypothetical protein
MRLAVDCIRRRVVRRRPNGREKAIAGAALYNLKDDPREHTKLAPTHPERTQQLAAAWQQWNSQLIDPLWGPPTRAKKK